MLEYYQSAEAAPFQSGEDDMLDRVLEMVIVFGLMTTMVQLLSQFVPSTLQQLNTGSTGVAQASLDQYKPSFIQKKAWGPTSAVLDLSGIAGRLAVETVVSSSVPGTFTILGSVDGVNYVQKEVITLTPTHLNDSRGFLNAFPFIKVETANAGVNQIDIIASR